MSETKPENSNPLVSIIMGSKSDWETMQHASQTLSQFGVAHECRVLSAHRTPQATTELISTAESRGVQVIIAAAGGAAHLAGVAAAHTVLPVLGVPMQSQALQGMDSLLVDGADAGGNSGRHAGHRQAGRNQRRAARDRDSLHLASCRCEKNCTNIAKSRCKGFSKRRCRERKIDNLHLQLALFPPQMTKPLRRFRIPA